ncbi:Mus7/MMS22 family-domain-containing protein [Trametes elegans]|nr:Mus7/MMS22 family-domain-containing protein [Trametes elegans]
MHDEDSVIQTSDQEELEELAAETADYWQLTTRDIARRRGAVLPGEGVVDLGLSGITPTVASSARGSQLLNPRSPSCDEPPLKRRKLDHDLQIKSPLVLSTNLPRPLSSAPSPHRTTRTDVGSSTPSPSVSHLIDAEALEILEDANKSSGLSDELPGGGIGRAKHTRSPSSSPDPISLFTPPRRQQPQPLSPMPVTVSLMSSPLTPPSSSPKHVQEPGPPSPGSSHVAPSAPNAAFSAELAIPHLPQQVAELAGNTEEDHGRYSFRTRNPLQLKPYEFDKKLYRRQMRGNPEAIVKVVSPPRPHRRHRSISAGRVNRSSGVEDEYEGGNDDAEIEEEDARWERRLAKGKEKARARSVSRGEDVHTRAAPVWYPDALREPLDGPSSEEDDAALDEMQRRHDREKRRQEKAEKQRQKEERKKKRRPRVFPLGGKDPLQPVSPPPEQVGDAGKSSSRPVSRPRPRPRPVQQFVASDTVAGSQDPQPGPSSPQRRHRSVTFSSPIRHTSAHSSGQEDGFGGWEDGFGAFDDLPLAVSPILLPPTSGAEDDASSDVHAPPPTSSTPPEVIDVPNSGHSNNDGIIRRRLPRVRSAPRPIFSELDSDSGSDPGSNSQSDSQPVSHFDDPRTRKRLKILQHMMPAVMIKKLQNKDSSASRARRATSESSGAESVGEGGEEAERPLRPGESRRRVRSRTQSNRSIEIRGDSESSDVDIPIVLGVDDAARPHFSPDYPFPSSGEDEIRPIAHRPRPRARDYNQRDSLSADISLSEDDSPAAHSDTAESISDVNEAVGRWVQRPNVPRRRRDDGEVHEGDLIDRMLSRTNVSSTSRAKRKKRARVGGSSRNGGGGGGGHAGGSRGQGQLRIVTGGTKRYGAGRQTRLPFKRLPTPEEHDQGHVRRHEQPPSPAPGEVFFGEEPQQKNKVKKHKPKANTTGLYVFPAEGTHLESGRSNAAPVTVDQEAVGGPRMRRPEKKSGPSTKSKSRRQESWARAAQPSTLEQYWPLGREDSDDSIVVPDTPVPAQPSSQQERDLELLRRVTVDLDIHPLPAGIAFPANTYLGRGWLYELINLLSGARDVPAPPSCTVFDYQLHPGATADVLNACMEALYDQARNLILGSSAPADYETCNKWQTFLHSVSQHLSWILSNAGDTTHVALMTNTESLIQKLTDLLEQPIEILPEDEKPNPLVLQIFWFVVEASCRLAHDRRRRTEEPDLLLVSSCIKAAISKLWDYTFGDSALQLDLSKDSLTNPSHGQQIAESWVCLINLLQDKGFEASCMPQGVSFWTLYLEVLQTKGLQNAQADLQARERMWRSVFTLCALSQFSLYGNSSMSPRLASSWQTISSILERAPLSADPVADAALPRRVIRKRDEYVRVLVSRCLWLNLKWHWRLDVDDASLVFRRLQDVFKTRRFANLADEPSDFPSFLRHSNLKLLHESKRSDTAFTLFLKMVVTAGEKMQKQNAQAGQGINVSLKLKKILSLAVPVGSVPFTKATPPSAHELSMLYNRFSAVAVAIYLEPTVANLKHRLASARRYVNYKDTDNETRRACIRGVMHLGVLLRHLELPLTDILDWLGEMTNVLIDEYQAAEPGKNTIATMNAARDWIVVAIQMLLGCVRNILETSSMNPGESRPKYPDPALIQGPWVTRVFSTSTTLTSVVTTGDQIRRFVQAFLDVRSRVIPKPRRPQPRVIAEDSQESQYDYDQFDLDLDDPELLAALGVDVGPSEQTENKEKDKLVSETIDKHILPAIYRLVCKHFNDPVYQQSGEISFDDADKWIDCWVGCASVVVQNGKKDWNFYLSFGSQSWEKIIEPDWRRRVGLRFMYKMLQLDPPAYLTYTDRFIDVLFECMATPIITLEHDYTSLLFSIDRLHHPLFHDLPAGAPGDDGDYHLAKHEFSEKRLALLRGMFTNLSSSLEAESDGDGSLTARNQIHITSVIAFLSTMKDIHERLDPGSLPSATYLTFCRAVSALIADFPRLAHHARLATLMTWLRSISQ